MKRLSFISSSLAKNFFLYLSSTLILALFFSAQSCKSPTAPSGNGNLSLTPAEVSCTEVWLNLSVNNIPLPTNIVIKKNGSPFLSFNLTSKDTTLYDSTLLPNKTYSYQAEYGKGFATERSESVTAKTMDTTSNNFTWQTFTFGVGGDNGFNDVAVVNDTSIFVVGNFNLQDSSGMFNVMHWDGLKWNPIRLEATASNGNVSDPQLTSILYFSKDDIWFAGGSIFHWDGKQLSFSLERYNFFNGGSETIEKLWGPSDHNIYGVGSLGTIVKYDGQNWQQIESGTTLNIQDIWGITDPITKSQEIYFVASDKYQGSGRAIFQIDNNTTTKVNDNGLPMSLSSIWFNDLHSAYIAGDGIFKNDLTNPLDNWVDHSKGVTIYYSHRIRGTGRNDIVVSGAGGDIAHYNGVSWQDYLGNGLQNFYGNLYGIDINGNTVCAVGESGSGATVQAVIILGKRN